MQAQGHDGYESQAAKIERAVRFVYRYAGTDVEDERGPAALLEDLLGPCCIRRVDDVPAGRAVLEVVRLFDFANAPVGVRVRSFQSNEMRTLACAHGVAQYAANKMCEAWDDETLWMATLAVAMPKEPFDRAMREGGARLVADVFCVPLEEALLRGTHLRSGKSASGERPALTLVR